MIQFQIAILFNDLYKINQGTKDLIKHYIIIIMFMIHYKNYRMKKNNSIIINKICMNNLRIHYQIQ